MAMSKVVDSPKRRIGHAPVAEQALFHEARKADMHLIDGARPIRQGSRCGRRDVGLAA
jgi:hypothetical protein